MGSLDGGGGLIFGIGGALVHGVGVDAGWRGAYIRGSLIFEGLRYAKITVLASMMNAMII